MKRMELQPGIGGTPIRKVLKKANLGSAPAELSKGKACKLTAVSSIANQCKKVAAGKNQFFCLFCDDIFPLRHADCPKTYGSKCFSELDGVTQPMADWMTQRYVWLQVYVKQCVKDVCPSSNPF